MTVIVEQAIESVSQNYPGMGGFKPAVCRLLGPRLVEDLAGRAKGKLDGLDVQKCQVVDTGENFMRAEDSLATASCLAVDS